MMYKIRRLFKSLNRSLSYAKHGFSSHDWDNVYLIEDITFKLKRMEKELFENGIAQHCRITKKSLRRAIELGEILTSDTPKDRNFIKECDRVMEREYFSEGFTKRKISTEYKIAIDLQHQQDKYNYDMFFTLLSKYSNYWWD